VGNMASRRMAANRGGLAPENMLENHIEQLNDTLRAQNIAAGAAASRTKEVVLGMPPCRETGQCRRSNSPAEPMSLVSMVRVPWHHGTLVDLYAALAHEGRSSVALKAVVGHIRQIHMSWAGCTMPAGVLHGSEQRSVALGSRLGNCVDFAGLGGAGY
jgi:hypothetical protein